ncbi:hypothetical protein [Nocardia sp. NPDC056100]|uniref:hypothetical protein n=1 Tax=Nocardia sp. NPDC056100 TaxID=3345712 RepID=UPI0035DCFBA2
MKLVGAEGISCRATRNGESVRSTSVAGVVMAGLCAMGVAAPPASADVTSANGLMTIFGTDFQVGNRYKLGIMRTSSYGNIAIQDRETGTANAIDLGVWIGTPTLVLTWIPKVTGDRTIVVTQFGFHNAVIASVRVHVD